MDYKQMWEQLLEYCMEVQYYSKADNEAAVTIDGVLRRMHHLEEGQCH